MAPFKKSGAPRAGGFKPRSFGGDTPRFAKKSFGGARSGGRERNGEGHDARLELFAATCANCHKACEVPFRPNGKKPVFCRDCFGEGSGEPKPFAKPAYSRDAAPREFTKREYSAPAASNANATIEDLKRQMDGMNRKLDAIVLALKDLA